MKITLNKIDQYSIRFFLLLVCLISISFNLIGQTDKGWKVNLGASIIEDDPKPGSDFYTEKIAPSINLGYFLKFKVSKKINFRTSLDVNLIQSKETRSTDYVYSRFINYLSVPLLIETNASKFNVGIGIQNSLKLFGGGETSFTESSVTTKTKMSGSEYNLFDFGAILNLNFSITEEIKIECQYYQGLSNIHSEESTRRNVNSWKVRQILIGGTVSINK